MTYIENLIEKFNSKEELPQSGLFKSSSDTVSYQAHREAEKINNIKYLSEMKSYISSNKNWTDIKKIAFICSWLIHNTNNSDAKSFYLELKRKNASSNTMMYLIDGAKRGKITEYAPIVREMMEIEARSNCHYSSGIDFLADVIGEQAVKELGVILDNDCYGRCTPFYCCSALERIGSKEGIPYLERAISRNSGGRKGWQLDAVNYSRIAISKINQSHV